MKYILLSIGAREDKIWEVIPTHRYYPITARTTTRTTTRPTQPPPPHPPSYPRYPQYYPRPTPTKPRIPVTYRPPYGKYTTPKPNDPRKPMPPHKKHYYPNSKDEKHGRKYPHQHIPHDKHPHYDHNRGKTTRKQEEHKPNTPPNTCDTSYDAIAVIRREVFIFKETVRIYNFNRNIRYLILINIINFNYKFFANRYI